MNASTRLLTALLVFLPTIGFSQQTISEYDKELSDGRLLGAASYVNAARASECGYLFIDHELDVGTAILKIRQKRSAERRKVLDKYLLSTNFKEQLQETNEIVLTAIKVLKRRNDQKTACLLLRDTLIQPILKTSTDTWR